MINDNGKINPPSACICNSQGSTKADDSTCDNKCCDDDGSCTCIPGYSTIDCNTCDIGYYVSDTVSNENSCTGIVYWGKI